MPQESLIYFGDTAHLPYGDKSPDAIRYYCLRISKFLMDQQCKAIVIACNSASAVAYDMMKDFFPDDIVMINAVDPLVQEIIDSGAHHIGVIGTRATIESNTYSKKLLAQRPSLGIKSVATPLLAPMIEDGFHQKRVSASIIQTYLEEFDLNQIETLALACTHYPLIADQIRSLLREYDIDIIDSAQPVAAELFDQLRRRDLLTQDASGSSAFYLSDTTVSFEKSASMFFGEELEIRLENLWV